MVILRRCDGKKPAFAQTSAGKSQNDEKDGHCIISIRIECIRVINDVILRNSLCCYRKRILAQKGCHSKVSCSFTYEESRENSFSFTSNFKERFFHRATCKKRQNDNEMSSA